jgi:hypothetical protein
VVPADANQYAITDDYGDSDAHRDGDTHRDSDRDGHAHAHVDSYGNAE